MRAEHETNCAGCSICQEAIKQVKEAACRLSDHQLEDSLIYAGLFRHSIDTEAAIGNFELVDLGAVRNHIRSSQ